MGLADWLRKIRSDEGTYGWSNTVNGRTAYNQMAVSLANALGVRPG